ncbi:sulfur carrier protein ThiS adenylyltransferase ThiF [Azotosporobacter soli]|uniref:sulfur carrier protein ThiS adenylyltransferase ThiF n=1 Tax=Azotosporobacter soli TaxID=3055040 RepID=UPI0031FE620A
MNEFEEGLAHFFTAHQLSAIRQTRIAIAGAGGLGSNVATHLVRSGFRRLLLIDFDVVSASNLNRQFYFSAQIGKSKVQALADNLLAINPDLELTLHNKTVTNDNIAALFAEYEIIVEAFDRAESKKMLSEFCLKHTRLLVAASGLGGWGNTTSIKPHRLRDNFYVVGDLTSEVGVTCPPLSPRVAIAAATQADLVLSFVLENHVAREE